MRIRYTKAANHDLELIAEYIADVLLAPDAAQKVVSGLITRISRLSEMPDMGLSVQRKFGLAVPDKYVLLDKYLVLYRVDADSDVISIGRILDTRTNYLAMLLKTTSPYD